MADIHHYFLTHAMIAIRKARALPFGRQRAKQRTVARIYHLLAKRAAPASTGGPRLMAGTQAGRV